MQKQTPETVTIHVEKDFKIGEVDQRLFSSFAEHMGRSIYTGIYEPGHPAADAKGFRTDVLELVRELNLSHVRYPGGNFLSGYDWKDGIGPKEARPRRLDLAWKSIESNQVGIDEFYDWSRLAGIQIMGGVNMGTGSPKDAAELVEYCNYPGGTAWSDRRIQNGHKDPMGISLWCIGNEMDGPWQIGHLDAIDYGKKAREAAKMMKWVDDSIEVVVCGSSNAEISTFPEWDRQVLEYTYDEADYLSMHRYFENEGNDLDFLASFKDMDQFISTLVATVDYVKAVKRSKKTIGLSFDEWNVWYQKRQTPHDWMEAPELIEDRYTLLDALSFSGMCMALLNHADRVKIACLAQLVNVIAPILTERGGRAIRQTIFYPFQLFSKHGRGTALRPVVHTPLLETRHGDAEQLYTSAVLHEDGTLSLFCLNIGETALQAELDLRSFGSVKLCAHTRLSGDDLNAVNTFDNPFAVVPQQIPVSEKPAARFSERIPARSFSVFSFAPSETL